MHIGFSVGVWLFGRPHFVLISPLFITMNIDDATCSLNLQAVLACDVDLLVDRLVSSSSFRSTR